LTASSITTPRPIRWSMIRGGTLPLRKPGTFTWFAIVRYAGFQLGFELVEGHSMVSFTRVGLRSRRRSSQRGFSCGRGWWECTARRR